MGPICRGRAGRRSRGALDTGSKSDDEQAARLREALTFSGADQVDEYLGVFLTDEKHAAQIRHHQEIRRRQSSRGAAVRGRNRAASAR